MRNWPDKDSDPQGLANEELGPNEIWDKGEAYMLQLLKPLTLIDRLKCWNAVGSWKDDHAYYHRYYTNIMNSYNNLEKHPILLGILGYALAIGNILNAGSNKGQSDGFETQCINKLNSMKDNTGRSMLKFILEKMYALNEDLHDDLKELQKSLGHKDLSVKSLDDKTRELNGTFGTTETHFKNI